MPDLPALEQAITGIFRQVLNIEPPSVDTDLFAEGCLDSLMLVDLLVKLEQTYGIRIALEQLELEHFRSVTNIAGFLRNCLQQQAANRRNSP